MSNIRQKYAQSLEPGTRIVRWTVVGEPEPEQRSDGKRARYRVFCECACGKCAYVRCDKLLSGQSSRCRSCARLNDWRRRKAHQTREVGL